MERERVREVEVPKDKNKRKLYDNVVNVHALRRLLKPKKQSIPPTIH